VLTLLVVVALAKGATDMYTWTTRADGVVVVRDAGGAEQIITLAGPNAAGMDHVEARWGDLCRRIGERHGIPDGWLQAMIWRESGGDPKARNPERLPGPEDDGIGLMQITSKALKAGHSDVELEDPALNIEIGASYVGSLIKRYGDDFPSVAAAYNAGSVRKPLPGFENPWGMHSSPGHITAEVSALNYYITRALFLTDVERARVLSLVLATDDEILRHDLERGETEPPPTLRERPPSA